MTRRGYRDPYIHSRRWKELRLQILRRDSWTCQIRGPRCTVQATQVDHIVKRAWGGHRSDPANLRAACAACNNDRNSPRFFKGQHQTTGALANLSPQTLLTGDYSRREPDDGDSAA